MFSSRARVGGAAPGSRWGEVIPYSHARIVIGNCATALLHPIGTTTDSGIPLQVPKLTRLPIFANSQKGNVRTGNCVDSLQSGPIVTSEDDPSCGAVAKARSLELAPNDSEVKGAQVVKRALRHAPGSFHFETHLSSATATETKERATAAGRSWWRRALPF